MKRFSDFMDGVCLGIGAGLLGLIGGGAIAYAFDALARWLQ